MEIELLEIRDFLAAHPPFNVLPAEALDYLPRKAQVRYLRRDTPFPPDTGETPCYMILRSGAVERRDAGGNLVEKLGEGDGYAEACGSGQPEPELQGVVSEDSLVYLLPCAQIQALRDLHADFDRLFTPSVRERLQQAVQPSLYHQAHRSLSQEIGSLITREPVTIESDMSIRQAAQLMAAQRVSALMVTEGGELAGVITDSDLRKRCLAAGLDAEQPCGEIMSASLQTIQRRAPVSEAMLTMTRLQIHHLPVLDGEQLAGMVTVTDLLRHQTSYPAFLASDIRRAESPEALAVIARRLPELQFQLVESGTTARDSGEAIASLTDAFTQRLLQLAEHRFGTPPVSYVWVAGGSQGRREQSVHSDQDNALIIADALSEADAAYFAELSRFVCDGLNACGFVYCPGNAMASNPEWRQPLRVWRSYFDTWIDRPEPRALMQASIFFDLRAVHGDATLLETLREHMLGKSRGNRIFIAHMVANALTHRPPLGFFRNFVLIHDGEHDATLDIKHRGIIPIVDLARVYALSEGLAAVSTFERLEGATASGSLSEEMGANLVDALELIASLRLRHQAGQIRAAVAPNNYLPPARLSGLERGHLKDAFRVIQTLQETLANRYQSGRFG